MYKCKRPSKFFFSVTCSAFLVYLFLRVGEFLGANYFGDRNGEFGSPIINLVLVATFSLITLFLIIFLLWWISKYQDQFKITPTYFVAIVFTLGITFLVASNMAWLNPRPKFREIGGDFLKLS
jgi:hypothetical protein